MRQFISSIQPSKDGLLEIVGKDFKYLRQVLRLKNGDMLNVRLPNGHLTNTTVCSIDDSKKLIILQVCKLTDDDFEENENITRGVKAFEIETNVENNFGNVDFYLFQYIAKPVKMEQIIRQAVECGVKYIVPVVGAFSQKSSVLSMSTSKVERIDRIVREARQQSGSPVETKILEPMTTLQASCFWSEQGTDNDSVGIVLWERNENSKSLHLVLNNQEKKRKVAIVVGCEGGISPEEIEILSKNKFNIVHFSTNILRCETAALYGIAAVQSAMFD